MRRGVAALLCAGAVLGGRSVRALSAEPPPAPPSAAPSPAWPERQPTDFVILANSTGLTELDSASLRAVFRGERTQWPSDRRVTVVLPSSRAGFAESVARTLFRNSPGGVQRYWLALVFQGRAAPPVFVDSAEETVAIVRRTPGAIAILPVDSIGGAVNLLLRVR